MKILSIVGARPNFMKVAPFIRAIEQHNQQNHHVKIEHILVHTGQHYDIRMSQKFFDDLNIPPANIHLEIGSGTHAEQVGKTMIAFEKVIQQVKPDWVVVIGDVNAILAGSVDAKKEHVKLAHIEAGLRSGDITMPEEINRLVADRLSDLLFTPDRISNDNLLKEGIEKEKIQFVGNIMIDTLEFEREKALSLSIDQIILANRLFDSPIHQPKIESERYALVTLHRPSNVDEPAVLKAITEFIAQEVTKDLTVIWSIHPRTIKQLEKHNILALIQNNNKVIALHPIGYHEMIRLNSSAKLVLTDSGGLQEESTILGTPCITLRWNTERPVTLTKHGGASVLVGNNIENIKTEYLSALKKDRSPVRPELWDGQTAKRIVKCLIEYKAIGLSQLSV
jgi:UDP-N-acetylglucosamine 2-epimerase (non-hydrolysing)